MKLHIPQVDDYGGAPFADHDYACPVCQQNKAILVLHTGVFHPCDSCRSKGWELRKRKFGKGKL